MKIVIDIEDAVLDCVRDRYADGEMPDDKSVFDMALYTIATGKQLPDNATNGDVIKALFPNAKFDNAMPFTDGRWETMNIDTEDKTRAMYKPTQLRTYADWWNAPYKAGDTE